MEIMVAILSILMIGIFSILCCISQNYSEIKKIRQQVEETNERLKKSLEEKTIGIDALRNNMSTTLNKFKNENNN